MRNATWSRDLYYGNRDIVKFVYELELYDLKCCEKLREIRRFNILERFCNLVLKFSSKILLKSFFDYLKYLNRSIFWGYIFWIFKNFIFYISQKFWKESIERILKVWIFEIILYLKVLYLIFYSKMWITLHALFSVSQ